MSNASTHIPGLMLLFGSGETSASGRKTWEWLFRQRPHAPRIAILETPAGFQPNTMLVAQRVKEFLELRLKNYTPLIDLVPARARGTDFSPDHADLLTPLLTADALFMGAGSPTYAARQLEGSLAWDILETRYQQGAAVILASAAILAASFFTLPVYEIYKVGEPLHWLTGLDFFSKYGLSAVYVPHWNNNDGGTELDTSRCFMGQARWAHLKTLLPHGTPVVGIDEHTSLILDPRVRLGRVLGTGNITVEMGDTSKIYPTGSTVTFDELGTFPESILSEKKLAYHPRQEILDMISAAQLSPMNGAIPAQVAALMEKRADARKQKDWAGADQIRDELLALGWTVQDTPAGPVATPLSNS
ncbi:MAG: cysteinyl-tRNA synthetase [Anaerolineales bacterium]|nr:cysteinyl-tRNA synthetase [Anaerolineales bacterium]